MKTASSPQAELFSIPPAPKPLPGRAKYIVVMQADDPELQQVVEAVFDRVFDTAHALINAELVMRGHQPLERTFNPSWKTVCRMVCDD